MKNEVKTKGKEFMWEAFVSRRRPCVYSVKDGREERDGGAGATASASWREREKEGGWGREVFQVRIEAEEH